MLWIFCFWPGFTVCSFLLIFTEGSCVSPCWLLSSLPTYYLLPYFNHYSRPVKQLCACDPRAGRCQLCPLSRKGGAFQHHLATVCGGEPRLSEVRAGPTSERLTQDSAGMLAMCLYMCHTHSQGQLYGNQKRNGLFNNIANTKHTWLTGLSKLWNEFVISQLTLFHSYYNKKVG